MAQEKAVVPPYRRSNPGTPPQSLPMFYVFKSLHVSIVRQERVLCGIQLNCFESFVAFSPKSLGGRGSSGQSPPCGCAREQGASGELRAPPAAARRGTWGRGQVSGGTGPWTDSSGRMFALVRLGTAAGRMSSRHCRRQWRLQGT